MTNECNDLDRRIIDALLRDGRATILDVAEQTDIPATTVQKRLSQLHETGVISGYESRIDYSQFGYELTAIFKLDLNGDATERFVNQLREEPHIISIYEVTGKFDLLAIGKYTDTVSMNEQIKSILTDTTIRAGNTSIVLDTVLEGKPVDLIGESAET